MATSNDRLFSLDVADVIEEAYERIGSEVRSGYQAQKARRSLNIMFQDWSNRGVNLWTVSQVTTPLQAGVTEYEMAEGDLDIVDAVVRVSGTDYRLDRYNRADFLSIPNKSMEGRPLGIYVERTTSPVFHIWPVPDGNDGVIITNRVRQIQDASKLAEDVDVPSRFIPPMVSGLAFYLAVKEAPDRVAMLEMQYESDFNRARDEDSERGSWHITPARSR